MEYRLYSHSNTGHRISNDHRLRLTHIPWCEAYKTHRVLLEEDREYRERYVQLAKELVNVIVGPHNSLRTTSFLGRVWFIKRSRDHILLSREPV